MGKNLPADAGDLEAQVQSLGQEDTLNKGMTIHSSALAWRRQPAVHGVTQSWARLNWLSTHAPRPQLGSVPWTQG